MSADKLYVKGRIDQLIDTYLCDICRLETKL